MAPALLPLIIPSVIGIIGEGILGFFGLQFRKKNKMQEIKEAKETLDDIIRTTVIDANQTIVKKYKQTAREVGERLPEKTKGYITNMVFKDVKTMLSKDLQKITSKQLGDLDKYIQKRIQRIVNEEKK